MDLIASLRNVVEQLKELRLLLQVQMKSRLVEQQNSAGKLAVGFGHEVDVEAEMPT